MAEEWHAPYDRLSRTTVTRHQALRSLMEELEAVDWYQQRADDCSDAELRSVLLHNMREEIEHASMVLEWLRRSDPDFGRTFDVYLYSKGPIVEVEEAAEKSGAAPPTPAPPTFTVGSLKP
ncbi:MAG: ferritin [Actinomycetota bacterium]